jgi:hypothetical protein
MRFPLLKVPLYSWRRYQEYEEMWAKHRAVFEPIMSMEIEHASEDECWAAARSLKLPAQVTGVLAEILICRVGRNPNNSLTGVVTHLRRRLNGEIK